MSFLPYKVSIVTGKIVIIIIIIDAFIDVENWGLEKINNPPKFT